MDIVYAPSFSTLKAVLPSKSVLQRHVENRSSKDLIFDIICSRYPDICVINLLKITIVGGDVVYQVLSHDTKM